MRDAFRELSSEKDYRYWFDPFWVRAEPYRVKVKRGESVEIQIHLRNFKWRAQHHKIELRTLPGLIADPLRLEGKLVKLARAAFPVRLRAGADANPAFTSPHST
jgi:hypothetical protein